MEKPIHRIPNTGKKNNEEIEDMVGEAKHEVTGKGTHKIYQPTQKKNQEETQNYTQENCFLRHDQN